MASRPQLILIHEPPAACEARLQVDGFDAKAAGEIGSYLAQSTDLALEFAEIADACADLGIEFTPAELDDAPDAIRRADRRSSLVWTLTDGIAYFRGGAAPAAARLAGFSTLGSDDSVFALCQDKFRAGAVLNALGLPTPPSGLCRNGEWIAPASESEGGWFVKPNRLGAKIGIWADSHCFSLAKAEEISRRVHAAYRDDVVVQPYVPGRNVRASFLAVEPGSGPDRLGVFYVESGRDFQTMAESLALYGDTGAAARADGSYAEPQLQPVAEHQPDADRQIRSIASALMKGAGLRDVFSIDLRVEPNGTVHLIEFEVCPGLPCFDFRAYCKSEWDLTLAEAMARAAATRLL